MYLDRVISLNHDLRSRSVFLFGPRQTGKTTLLRQRYSDAFWVNLLDGRQFLKYSAEPWRLAEETTALTAGSIVVIDEIQRLPVLLNEVHNLIETRDLRFVLTGSSPVKLRRGGVNLLGGRARLRYLSPLVFPEIPEWNLHRIVVTGRRTVAAGTPEYGSALEQYIFTELESWVSYERLNAAVMFWRTVDEREVDFVISDRLAIEVKAGGSVGRGDLKGLFALREDAPELRPVVVCEEDTPRVIDGIDILPVRVFLERLWGGML